MAGVWEAIAGPLADYGFMRYGMGVAAIVGVTSGVLSCLLVVRRQALMGDAIAHAVLLGVALGWMAGGHVGIFWGALATAMLAGLAIAAVERSSRVKLDAAMGVVFTAAFALGITVISVARPRGVDLFHVLLGNILGVGPADLALSAASGTLVVGAVAALYRPLHAWSFDPVVARAVGVRTGALHYLFTVLLSAAIVAALQAVGLVLVVAMLVTPGAAAYLMAERLATMMGVAAAIGLVAGVAGLYGSFYLDVPSGPAMVLVASALFVLALLLAPRRGLVSRRVGRRLARARALADDLLATVVKLDAESAGAVSLQDVVRRARVPRPRAELGLTALARRGLVTLAGDTVAPTPAGRGEAVRLIRTHRLLETYLHDAERVPLDELHAEADRMEHEWPAGLVDDLDRELGRPAADPHGHPIPGRDGQLGAIAGRSLSVAAPGTAGRVTMVSDDRDDLLREMVRLRIVPQQEITVLQTGPEGVRVGMGDRELLLRPDLASRIYMHTVDGPAAP